MAHMAQSKWSQAEDWLSITGRVEMSLWEPSCPGHSPVTWKSEHRTDTIDLRCCKNGISRLSWFAVNHFHIPGSAMWTGPAPSLSSNSNRQYLSAGQDRRRRFRHFDFPGFLHCVRYLHTGTVCTPARPALLCRYGHTGRVARQLFTHIWKTAKGLELDHDSPKCWAGTPLWPGSAQSLINNSRDTAGSSRYCHILGKLCENFAELYVESLQTWPLVEWPHRREKWLNYVFFGDNNSSHQPGSTR